MSTNTHSTYNGNNPHPKTLNRSTGYSYSSNAGIRAVKPEKIDTHYNLPPHPGQEIPANKKEEEDQEDGWNEATDSDEKVNWRDMPITTPIIGNTPHLTLGHIKNNSMPSNTSVSYNNDQSSSINIPDDGGWISGHATNGSPPSQPFHVNGDQRMSSNPLHTSHHSENYHSKNAAPPPMSHVERVRQHAIHLPRDFAKLLRPNDTIDHAPYNSYNRFHIPDAENVQSQVPTYTAPPTNSLHYQDPSRDPNRVPVPHAKQWGKPASLEPEGKFEDAPVVPEVPESTKESQPTTETQPNRQNPEALWSDIGTPSQVEWNQDDRLTKWAKSIAPVPPVHQPTPLTSHAPSEVLATTAEDEDHMSRVESVVEPAPAATIEYSDDGHQNATPALTEHSSNPSVQAESEVIDPAFARPKAQKPPPILTVAAEGNQLPSTPPSGSQKDVPTGPRRFRKRNNVKRSWESKKTHWWKRAPHPMFSPLYASRRLLVGLPFPIKIDTLKQMMHDHFSKYGTIQSVWHHEANGNFCEKAFVVFQEPQAVKEVYADPRRTICAARSTTHPGGAPFELTIKPSSSKSSSRTVLIRLTGKRVDARARSASPNPFPRDDVSIQSESPRRDQLDGHHKAMLPSQISIDAVPSLSRDGQKLFWRVKIRPENLDFNYMANQLRQETGKDLQQIGQIDLRRRVPEKHIIPQLCQYFAEVCDICPPTMKGQGWLVTVGGVNEARHMMSELQGIPGFFVRWADEGDGYNPAGSPGAATSILTEEPVSPMTRFKNETEGRPSKSRHHNFLSQHVEPTNSDDPVNHPESQPRNPMSTENPQNELPPSPVTPLAQSSGLYGSAINGYSPNHPHLRRMIIHTYKGRPLVEDTSSGQPKYVDDRAIFVGKLVKHAETGATLLKRFERYGRISTIEYNPLVTTSTYATARILYQDKESAQRAIINENNNVSFGSAIKVEIRKVLPTDVHTKEMYVDDIGRAISPSMVSQYSPPSASIPPPSSLPSEPIFAPPFHPVPFAGYPHMTPFPVGIFGQAQYSQQYIPSAGPLPASQIMHPQTIPVNPNSATSPLSPGSPVNPLPLPTLPPHMHIPMLCAAWGIGYLPPGSVPMPPFGQYNPASAPPPTFKATQNETVPPPVPIPTAKEESEALSVSSSFELPDELSSRSKLKPIAFTNEDGMLKPVYDPKDLKEYCDENKITLPKGATSPKTVRQEEVTLLPVQSGGHDPVIPPAQNEFSHDIPNHTNQPTWPSLNNYPRPSSNATETRTVPVPIPFSPVESVRSLPSIKNGFTDYSPGIPVSSLTGVISPTHRQYQPMHGPQQLINNDHLSSQIIPMSRSTSIPVENQSDPPTHIVTGQLTGNLYHNNENINSSSPTPHMDPFDEAVRRGRSLNRNAGSNGISNRNGSTPSRVTATQYTGGW
ncbi:uncharacterized protein L201_003732 [Kwoniella dendrophila CBS 6074]|uniref:RRM domain-containing protein n=1 Tax=Kwoniella dendrophila CBS 6074 TaxID=1295534 RepID=A0AAX4JV95_9TREE